MEKAKAIKLLIIDIDGTLTDGQLFYGSNNIEMRGFHVQDGLGLKLLQKSGVEVAVISAKRSDIVVKRLDDLGIKHRYLGCEDKRPAYQALKDEFGLSDTQIAYMGDDLPDLCLLMQAGFAASVPDAPAIVHQHVDYISKKEAGKGAVREVCELIMNTQETYQSVVQSYLL